MPVLYEVVELANGDVALQREGDRNGQPLVTMRFSTELLRFLRSGKMDIAKIMIEAGLEEVAKLAEDFSEKEAEYDSAAATSGSDSVSSEDRRTSNARNEKHDASAVQTKGSLKANTKNVESSSERKGLVDKRKPAIDEDEFSEIKEVSHLIH